MPSTHANRHPRRLVIADDSAEMRWLVHSAVGDDFSEVMEASNGRELFWELMRSSLQLTDEDLVLVTDMYMPVYDGLQVLDAWRELHPDAATILITAFPTDELVARARALGIRLLAKPFSTAQLKAVIDEATRDHHPA